MMCDHSKISIKPKTTALQGRMQEHTRTTKMPMTVTTRLKEMLTPMILYMDWTIDLRTSTWMRSLAALSRTSLRKPTSALKER